MEVKRNAYMRLRFGRPPELDLLLEGQTLEIHDHRVIRAIVFAEAPTDINDLEERLRKSIGQDDASLAALLQDLLAAQVLVPADYHHPSQTAAEHWQRRGWLDAMILHLRSRDLTYSDFGAAKCIRPRRLTVEDELEIFGNGAEVRAVRSEAGLHLPAPAPHWTTHANLLEVMSARRSGGPWKDAAMTEQMLADLLAAGNQESLRNRKIAHSACNEDDLYDCSSFRALETYVVCNRVLGVAAGVYRYDVESHRLMLVQEGDFSNDLVSLCIGQRKVRGCAVAFLIGACWARYFALYKHPRAYRNLLINTAELAHEYILAATAASLSNFITPAFNDAVAAQLLRHSNLELGPLYLVALG